MTLLHTILMTAVMLIVSKGAQADSIPRCIYIQIQDIDNGRRGQYNTNIHHQSEYVLPAMDYIMRTFSEAHASLPLTILTDIKLVAWTRTLLGFAHPTADVITDVTGRFAGWEEVCGDLASVPRGGRVVSSCAQFVQTPEFWPRLRQAAARHCGIPIPRRCDGHDSSPPRIGILNRHTRRSIANVEVLTGVLRRNFKADVVYHLTYDNATFCQQLEWFSGVDVIVVAHGQAASNNIFLANDTMMVEVLPWPLMKYCNYRRTISGSGVRIAQNVVRQQPQDVYRLPSGAPLTQAQCSKHQECYHWYRDHINLTIHEGDLLESVRRAGGIRKVCQDEGTFVQRGVRMLRM